MREEERRELSCTPRAMRPMAPSKLGMGFWKDATASEQPKSNSSATAAPSEKGIHFPGRIWLPDSASPGLAQQPGLPSASASQFPSRAASALILTLLQTGWGVGGDDAIHLLTDMC